MVGIFLSYPAYSATLIGVKVKAEKGKSEITFPIEFKLESSERVSGIQFDIVIPRGTKITNMIIGSSAQKANKMVSFNQIKSRTYRTIVAGLNQEPILDGTILFVNIAIENQELVGEQLINLENPVLADPEGNPISCTVIPGKIFFVSKAEENLKQSENPPDTENQPPISSAEEKQGESNLKNIGLTIIAIVIVFVIIAVFTKKIINSQNKNIQTSKFNKKTKKKNL